MPSESETGTQEAEAGKPENAKCLAYRHEKSNGGENNGEAASSSYRRRWKCSSSPFCRVPWQRHDTGGGMEASPARRRLSKAKKSNESKNRRANETAGEEKSPCVVVTMGRHLFVDDERER